MNVSKFINVFYNVFSIFFLNVLTLLKRSIDNKKIRIMIIIKIVIIIIIIIIMMIIIIIIIIEMIMIMNMIINAPSETVALAKARAFTRKRLQQEASGTDLLQTEARASAPSALRL